MQATLSSLLSSISNTANTHVKTTLRNVTRSDSGGSDPCSSWGSFPAASLLKRVQAMLESWSRGERVCMLTRCHCCLCACVVLCLSLEFWRWPPPHHECWNCRGTHAQCTHYCRSQAIAIQTRHEHRSHSIVQHILKTAHHHTLACKADGKPISVPNPCNSKKRAAVPLLPCLIARHATPRPYAVHTLASKVL